MSLPKCTFWPFVRTRQDGASQDTRGKDCTCQCRRCQRCRFDPWVRKILWRRARQPSPGFLPGKSPSTEEPGRLQSMGSQSQMWLSIPTAREDSKTKGKGWKCIPTKFIPPKRECVNQLMNLQDVKWEKKGDFSVTSIEWKFSIAKLISENWKQCPF